MYTLLTTWPESGSGNVGDKLITESAKEFVEYETNDGEFLEIFRGESIDPKIEEINDSKAIFVPGFAIREPIYPETYRLTTELSKISVPIVPLGTGWKSYPGDFLDNTTKNYKSETVDFIKEVASELTYFSTREYYTERILNRHGITNSLMTGDCAWYDVESFGEQMHRPDSIDKLVFTTPHSEHYRGQAIRVVNMLAEEFGDAELYCSFHSELTPHEREIRSVAESRGFNIVHAANSMDAIEFYEDCDLHIGYRVHGHIAFLRKRIPSVLINEDGRGVGFTETFNLPRFDAFARRLSESWIGASRLRSKAGTAIDSKLPLANQNLVEQIRLFVQEELDSGFRRFQHIPTLIDETYQQRMKKAVNQIDDL